MLKEQYESQEYTVHAPTVLRIFEMLFVDDALTLELVLRTSSNSKNPHRNIPQNSLFWFSSVIPAWKNDDNFFVHLRLLEMFSGVTSGFLKMHVFMVKITALSSSPLKKVIRGNFLRSSYNCDRNQRKGCAYVFIVAKHVENHKHVYSESKNSLLWTFKQHRMTIPYI